ncbi:hypothetical protein GCM10023063_44920 [Arthrobacter methylotrophus]|uniref:Phosphatase PAP2 family protein n=1 Tax=Arthrobacter methylotrophus TaxID=121291 RepID=A0ABV5UM78_9MICC
MARILLPRRLAPGRTTVIAATLLAIAVILGVLLAGNRTPPFQALDDAWNGFAVTLHTLRSVAFSAVAGLTVMLLTHLLKWIIERPRPANANVATDTYSYPSGHVSATAAFVLVVALLIGRAWAWLLAIGSMLAMMVSRTYLAAHWATDVVGGACLASGVVLLLWLGFQNICIQENTDAHRAVSWKLSVASRKRHAGQRV